MDEEKNKLNNVPPAKPRNDSGDEIITDGFFDLSNLYSASRPKTSASARREAELRRRDEERRASEMRAVREDIERRYSLQLENARIHAESGGTSAENPKLVPLPKIDEREAVKEELDRIDKIINAGNASEIRRREALNRERGDSSDGGGREREFDVSQKNPVYVLLYNYGAAVYRSLFTVFSFIFKLTAAPFIRLRRLIFRASANAKKSRRKRMRNTILEIKRFSSEIKLAGKTIKKAFRSPLSLPAVILHYFRKAWSRHRKLLKSAVNVLAPVAAALLFVITIRYWRGVTFALEVVYNEKTIGYIRDEAVYIEAKDLVKERLNSGAYSAEKAEENASPQNVITKAVPSSPVSNLNARYSLSLVSREQLKDARAISDKIIENSVDNLTHACGVFVDGEFVCAVKNEADAKTVFYNILEPYEKDAREKGYVVGFAETIDYVQGLYSDDESHMADAARLASILSGEREPPTVYVLTAGDSIESAARRFKVDEDYLRRVNPGYDWGNAKEGDSVTVKTAKKFVGIKKIVSSSTVEEIKFDVVKKRDATKYSGYTQVKRKGVNGLKRTTKTSVYIDGILQGSEYDYDVVKEPVAEIVTVGTKTSRDGVYIGSTSKSGFLWPAPSCRCVSSPYGWRSRGWHKGMDLCRAGGGALGTPVIASKSGRVEVVQRSDSGYGCMVLINHGDGYKTRYAHMIKGSITVSTGDYVEAGRVIGKVGSTGNSTGPHLHFEVIKNGETQNPKNYIS